MNYLDFSFYLFDIVCLEVSDASGDDSFSADSDDSDQQPLVTDPQKVLDQFSADNAQHIKSFIKQLTRVKTGRASVALLDPVKVQYYGSSVPLNQVASLSLNDARTIVISPFEKGLTKDIEKGVLMANIGLQPSSDGQVVRVMVPSLSKEGRLEIVKSLKKTTEMAKVTVRNYRKSANNHLKKMQKDKSLSQDQAKDWQNTIQEHTDKFIKNIDELSEKKQKEIMTF